MDSYPFTDHTRVNQYYNPDDPVLFSDGNQQKIHFLDTGSFQVHNELITYYVKMARLCIVVTDFKKKQSYQIAQKIVNFIHSIQGKRRFNLSSKQVFPRDQDHLRQTVYQYASLKGHLDFIYDFGAR